MNLNDGKSQKKNIIKQRTLSLNRKFPEIQNENQLTEKNIWLLVEKLNLSEKIDKEKAKELFNMLDIDHKGKIEKSALVEYMTKYSQTEIDSSFKAFFEIINQELASKSEKIISKLKKLREISYFNKDDESINDINWIIKELVDLNMNEDFNDIEFNLINKLEHQATKTGNIDDKNAVEYIAQYSKYWDQSRKTSDLSKVNMIYSSIKFSQRSSIYSSDKALVNKYSQEISECRKGSSLLNSINCNPKSALKLADSFEFNVFELDELVQTKTLYLMSNQIFNQNLFLDFVDEDKFIEFINIITLGYDRNVQYHNDIHAADVLQTTFTIIKQSDIQNKISLKDIDILSVYISAIIHDFKHPGFTNIYHINAKTKLAVRFNGIIYIIQDASVLENYHISQAFKVLLKPKCNFLSDFSPEEFRTVRRRIIECVLATDMANHTKYINALKNKIESYEIKLGTNIDKLITPDNFSKNYENQQLVLSNILHAADISNPAKPSKIYDIFIKKLFDEFFNQGDIEKKYNLPVSLLCDRSTTNIDKAQVGFMNFIVLPFYEILYQITPEIQPYINNIKSNLKRYEDLSKFNDQKSNKDK